MRVKIHSFATKLINMKKKIIVIELCIIVAIFSCNQSDTKETKKTAASGTQTEDSTFNFGHNFFRPLPAIAESADNPITLEKVKLGKLLYFDTRLSKTGNNSCNSCHNAAFHVAQFWDGRAKDVEEQAGGPILNPVEMAIPSKDFLVKKLKGTKDYADLFKAAYPTDKDPLTFINIEKSIGAFERTLVTPSPFDNYLRNDYAALSADQKEGLKTFMTVGCIECHNGVVVGGSTFKKFGMYGDYRTFTHSTTNDEGRKKLTKLESDKDFFKVPSLRNVAKTFPYFHDGSVSDLKQAVL